MPEQICIVCSAGDADSLPPYEAVSVWLHGRIIERIRDPHPRIRGIDSRDLYPANLTLAFAADQTIRWLQDVQGGDGVLQPLIVLPPAGKHRDTRALYYYRIGVPSSAENNPTDDDDPNVRELVNLINVDVLSGDRRGDTGLGWSVVAATPNWLTTGAGDGWTGPGPGARPEPVRSGDVPHPGRGHWTFRFDRSPLNRLVGEARASRKDSRITVAVLDTCPAPSDVARAASAFPGNVLLQDVETRRASGRIVIDDPLSPVPAGFLGSAVANWDEDLTIRPRDLPTRETYEMPDHGLFAVGIIHDIAPGAEIHLIRALGDRGAGSTGALVDLLDRLRQTFNPSREKPLVVNLSLVVNIAPGVAFLKSWLPSTYASLRDRVWSLLEAKHGPKPDIESVLAALPPEGPEILSLLRMTHLSLHEAIARMEAQWVLVVAAAGNENNPFLGLVHLPEPCWPARYQEVFGVAAVTADSARQAQYSNRGDVLALGNGIAVFGGEARRASASAKPTINTSPVPPRKDVDAIRGIFSAKELPVRAPGENRPNETGWVYWVGTSFATPIVSGIAAVYWDRNPGLRPGDVMQAIRMNFGELLGGSNDPDGALDCRTIRAYQEFVPAP